MKVPGWLVDLALAGAEMILLTALEELTKAGIAAALAPAPVKRKRRTPRRRKTATPRQRKTAR